MPDLKAILALEMPEYEVSYAPRDAMLHALTTGFSADPQVEAELPFAYEGKGQKVSPAFASGLGKVGVLVRESPGTGLDHGRAMHAEIRVAFHRPLLPRDDLRVRERVVEVLDKGPGRGLLVHLERKIRSKGGDDVATIVWTSYYLTGGGIGGSTQSAYVTHPVPDRIPDATLRCATGANQALLFRLVLGDTNPLHADPQAARRAGFDRTLLHGLCTFGIACKGVLEAFADFDPARIVSLEARFSAPVFSGETFVTELWRDDRVVSFRCRSVERGVIALNNGRAVLK